MLQPVGSHRVEDELGGQRSALLVQDDPTDNVPAEEVEDAVEVVKRAVEMFSTKEGTKRPRFVGLGGLLKDLEFVVGREDATLARGEGLGGGDGR
jgi:hypothetical protein